MPRAFDSDDVTRPGEPLRFTEHVDCPSCELVFEGQFRDDSLTVEDMTDPPTGDHTCPGCQHAFSSDMTGWTFFSEAG